MRNDKPPTVGGQHQRCSVRSVALMLIGLCLFAAVATAAPDGAVKVQRCGYITEAGYGKVALYPWRMSCKTAGNVVRGSDNRHAATVGFGAPYDGEAIKINGHYWACTGQMGIYSCGYPYRPVTVNGVRGFKGPFTEAVQYQACNLIAPGLGACAKASQIRQPRS